MLFLLPLGAIRGAIQVTAAIPGAIPSEAAIGRLFVSRDKLLVKRWDAIPS